MEYNLADLFESVVDVVPDREALVYVDHPGTGAERRLTYAELDAAANRIGHHLIDSRDPPRRAPRAAPVQRRSSTCRRCSAASRRGSCRSTSTTVTWKRSWCTSTGTPTWWRWSSTRSSPGGWRPRCRSAARLRHLVRVGRRGRSGAGRTRRRGLRRGGGGRARRSAGSRPRSGDDQFIIYTGGTTGMPKGVMWRQEDLFFSGLGGGAPTGEPVKRPRGAGRAGRGGRRGDHLLPHSPADARHLDAHRRSSASTSASGS